MMRVNMLLEHTWSKADDPHSLAKLVRILDHVTVTVDGETPEHGSATLECLRTAVNLSPAPHLVRPEDVTLDMIAENLATVASDLPSACARLFANVAGPGMTLNSPDFPDFAQAIQYSITTPGALCHTKLGEKEKQFGYLRVTIDNNQGDSPGQPYVLELWPAGNGSPIHNHGNANAVIKVLHGKIQVNWYSGLAPGINKPWGSTIAYAGEVTFLTPTNYQIHRLYNPSPQEFTATIQSYRCSAEDNEHYEYFDWIKDEKLIEHFEPDSDWDFLTFKELIRAEYAQARPLSHSGADEAAQPHAASFSNGVVAPAW
ncbi:hypothetical protein OC844_006857 [Tilletia horrida]|nr:hypothetical protein OC844_006857 [Tilletia horrida]